MVVNSKLFELDTTHVHHDTTSRTVYGDYDLYREDTHDQPFIITFGFSKDHRPDLKQLVHSLLCVDAGIPIYSKCENGNESDKTINRNVIPAMVERMKELVPGVEVVYEGWTRMGELDFDSVIQAVPW